MAGMTRGAFAYKLFEKLGLKETSDSSFTDAGYLAGILGAFEDAGIVNGKNEGTFGTSHEITRGEAFTMLARAYGLADAKTSVADAAKALQEAGVVRGTGGSGNLDLSGGLRTEDFGHLMNQFDTWAAKNPEGFTPVNDDAVVSGRAGRLDTEIVADPEYAAQLRGYGLSREQIRSAFDAQQAQIENRLMDLAAQTNRQQEQFSESNQNAHEQRGFIRSGQYLRREAEGMTDIEDAAFRTQNSYNESLSKSQHERDLALVQLDREQAEAEAAARVRLGNTKAQRTLTEYEGSLR